MRSTTDFVERLVAERARRLPMTEPAFLAFYANTARPLAGYLRRLTGNAAVAEDLLQDAYVRLLVATHVPDDDDHRRNLLFKVATNLARDHFRRVSRQAPLEAAGAMACEGDAGATGDVWSRLALISARDRELLLLAYVEGFTHAEIASVTGLMRASVGPLLFRARKRFAAVLRAAGLGAPEIAS